MAEYIEVGQLWNCETCYHNGQYGCTFGLGCDHGESYRPAYGKLKKADVVVVVRCKDCIHRVYVDMGGDIGAIGGCRLFRHAMPLDDFCSYGKRKKE